MDCFLSVSLNGNYTVATLKDEQASASYQQQAAKDFIQSRLYGPGSCRTTSKKQHSQQTDDLWPLTTFYLHYIQFTVASSCNYKHGWNKNFRLWPTGRLHSVAVVCQDHDLPQFELCYSNVPSRLTGGFRSPAIPPADDDGQIHSSFKPELNSCRLHLNVFTLHVFSLSLSLR